MKMRSGRRTAFALIAALIAYGGMELAAYAMYAIARREIGFLGSLRAAMREVADSRGEGDDFERVGIRVPWHVPLHPFFGSGNPRGFEFLEKETPARADPAGAVVAITGGSVAQHLYRDAAKRLEQQLFESGVFDGRNVYVVLLGTGTWKQPQQLMSIAYYLTMGGRLDVLVNLDGHNEVADTAFNYSKGVYFAYPWLWYHLTSNVVSDEEQRLIGRIAVLRDARAAVARRFRRVSFSVTATVVWSLADRAIESRIARDHEAMAAWQGDRREELPAFRSGPKVRPGSRDELLIASARLWRHASVQLHRLVTANRGRYFHFLQPNQYIEGSKPLSDDERRRFRPRGRPGLAKGYGLLLEESRELQAQGIDFVSLVPLFERVHETVYADACCHFNPRGSEMMADAIAAHVVTSLKRTTAR